ncbi:unnamed protein product [Pleuronectes platessa]|uniref:Uncharacterized protein n=1 Tax=Pleuronectes platessa TaxID=8262 RepID=A0A9N7UQF0_PLEPL|nr:unnamed protein product [Pleuronectes platessa]
MSPTAVLKNQKRGFLLAFVRDRGGPVLLQQKGKLFNLLVDLSSNPHLQSHVFCVGCLGSQDFLRELGVEPLLLGRPGAPNQKETPPTNHLREYEALLGGGTPPGSHRKS